MSSAAAIEGPLDWKRMLHEIPGLDPDLANAILREYPNLNTLLETYRNLYLPQDRKNLLNSIEIPAQPFGPFNVTMKVGEEASARVYSFLSSLIYEEGGDLFDPGNLCDLPRQ